MSDNDGDEWDTLLPPTAGSAENVPTMSIRERVQLLGKQTRDARVEKIGRIMSAPKQLKGHTEHVFTKYYDELRNLNRMMAFNGILSLLMGICLNELKWQTMIIIPAREAKEGVVYTPANFSTLVELLKIGVSVNVVLVLWNVNRYYNAVLRLGKISGALLPQDNFYSAGIRNDYLWEMCILFIHPVPGLDFHIDVGEVFGYSRYSVDDLLTVAMLPRVYLLFRVFREEFKLNHESFSYVGKLGGVDLGQPLVILKQMVIDYPLQIIPGLYAVTIAVMAYALMCFERPTNDEFHSYPNSMWCVLVTMAMVGYGDLYPCTNFGRLSAIVFCGAGLSLYAVLLIGVKNVMEFDAKQLKVVHLLKMRRWKAVYTVQAAIVLQSFWRSLSALNTGLTKLGVEYRDTKLADEIRKLRALKVLEPLEERNISNTLYSLWTSMADVKERVASLDAEVDEYLLRKEGNAMTPSVAALGRV